MIICYPRRPCHLCQDPDSISPTFLEQFALVFPLLYYPASGKASLLETAVWRSDRRISYRMGEGGIKREGKNDWYSITALRHVAKTKDTGRVGYLFWMFWMKSVKTCRIFFVKKEELRKHYRVPGMGVVTAKRLVCFSNQLRKQSIRVVCFLTSWSTETCFLFYFLVFFQTFFFVFRFFPTNCTTVH